MMPENPCNEDGPYGKPCERARGHEGLHMCSTQSSVSWPLSDMLRGGTPEENAEAHRGAAISYAKAIVGATNLGVALEREKIVAWLRQAPDRMEAQKAAGAGEIHYMHTIGLLDAAKGLADAIERGEHLS